MVELFFTWLLSFFSLGLLAMKPVRLRLGTLLAADATTLAPAVNANVIALIKASFTPTENFTPADITLADFDGSTPLAAAVGAQQVGLDPLTGEQLVTIKEPLGGWRWITTGVTNLPQSIYGYALLDSTLATLLAIQVLDTPIPLTAVGQEVNLGTVKLTIVLAPMF